MNNPSPHTVYLSLVAAFACMMFLAGTALGQDTDRTPLEVFNNKVRERNTVMRQLHRLESHVPQLAAEGESRILIEAQMQTLEDKLMTIETRLTIMSSRLGVDIPSPPSFDPPAIQSQLTTRQKLHAVSEKISPDGVARSHKVFQGLATRMASSLRFEGYPTYTQAGGN